MKHPGVWCCEHRDECGCPHNSEGICWGLLQDENETYIKIHNGRCSGKLIQLLPPSDGKITDTERLDFVLQFFKVYQTEEGSYCATRKHKGFCSDELGVNIRDIIDRAIIK